MSKVKSTNPVLKVYADVLSVRRSSRHGHRRTHRHARKVKRDRTVDRRKAKYDRDMGGYNAWGPKAKRTKREKRQVEKERDLVRKLGRKKKMTVSGYAEDDFVASDDANVEENTFRFDTDHVLDLADAQEANYSLSDKDWDSSSDDSDGP
jgi:hypothetical protein|tara:strand:+ start:1295 stop:1744 length:450 start_codon:yes stop_codon:yes gene_type:complete